MFRSCRSSAARPPSRGLLIPLTVALLSLNTMVGAARAQPAIVAASGIVIDAATGRILYSKNAHQRMYPASITKILTAVVALEYGGLNETVSITPQAANTEGSKMHILAGEQFTLEELLYGLLLVSGNDAGVAIAQHIAGSVADFAKLMNQTAARIGATGSHFTNPHGLPDTNHYTTAYDMALITQYALRFPALRTIVATPVKEIPARSGQRARRLASGNWMLGQGGIDGVKTGYTRAAQHTYVASAERDGRRVIAVVLHTGPKAQKWRDALALINDAYARYRWQYLVEPGEHYTDVPVEGGVAEHVRVETAGEAIVPILPSEEGAIRLQASVVDSLSAPVTSGTHAGHLNVYVDTVDPDTPLARIDLVASEEVAEYVPTLWERIILTIKRLWAQVFGG